MAATTSERNRVLPIVLPPKLYRKLELAGRAAERDAVQQARWILKQALEPECQPDSAR